MDPAAVENPGPSDQENPINPAEPKPQTPQASRSL